LIAAWPGIGLRAPANQGATKRRSAWPSASTRA